MGRTLKTLVDLAAKKKYRDCVLIRNWDELRDYAKKHGKSKTHQMVIDEYSGYLNLLKPEDRKWDSKKPYRSQCKTIDHYLSTHTFYGKGQWLNSTITLNECGFKVILMNWDDERDNTHPEDILKKWKFYCDEEISYDDEILEDDGTELLEEEKKK